MSDPSSSIYRVISTHDFAEIRQKISNEQNALFSLRAYNTGDVVADFSAGTISEEPTYLTVQVGTNRHITLQPTFLQYIDHSCDPNVFFDTTAMKLVALKNISAEEEFSFFYPSAEWKMTQSFNCYCGSPKCIGENKGASFLSAEQVSQYRFTDYIQEQLSKEQKKRVA